MSDPTTPQIDSSSLCADPEVVLYDRRLDPLTGDRDSTMILLSVLRAWAAAGHQPFTRSNGEWCELLGLSEYKFGKARERIAAHVSRGDSRTEALQSAMVIYYTDRRRDTHYEINTPILLRRLELCGLAQHPAVLLLSPSNPEYLRQTYLCNPKDLGYISNPRDSGYISNPNPEEGGLHNDPKPKGLGLHRKPEPVGLHRKPNGLGLYDHVTQATGVTCKEEEKNREEGKGDPISSPVQFSDEEELERRWQGALARMQLDLGVDRPTDLLERRREMTGHPLTDADKREIIYWLDYFTSKVRRGKLTEAEAGRRFYTNVREAEPAWELRMPDEIPDDEDEDEDEDEPQPVPSQDRSQAAQQAAQQAQTAHTARSALEGCDDTFAQVHAELSGIGPAYQTFVAGVRFARLSETEFAAQAPTASSAQFLEQRLSARIRDALAYHFELDKETVKLFIAA